MIFLGSGGIFISAKTNIRLLIGYVGVIRLFKGFKVSLVFVGAAIVLSACGSETGSKEKTVDTSSTAKVEQKLVHHKQWVTSAGDKKIFKKLVDDSISDQKWFMKNASKGLLKAASASSQVAGSIWEAVVKDDDGEKIHNYFYVDKVGFDEGNSGTLERSYFWWTDKPIGELEAVLAKQKLDVSGDSITDGYFLRSTLSADSNGNKETVTFSGDQDFRTVKAKADDVGGFGDTKISRANVMTVNLGGIEILTGAGKEANSYLKVFGDSTQLNSATDYVSEIKAETVMFERKVHGTSHVLFVPKADVGSLNDSSSYQDLLKNSAVVDYKMVDSYAQD